MKKHKDSKSLLIMITSLLVFLGSVTSFSSESGVTERIKKATINKEKAKGMGIPILVPVDCVRAKVNYQGGEFYTESRKKDIERFKCSSCHNNKKVLVKNAAKMVHGDIKVTHGEKDNPLDCLTCHSKNDRDFLNTSKIIK